MDILLIFIIILSILSVCSIIGGIIYTYFLIKNSHDDKNIININNIFGTSISIPNTTFLTFPHSFPDESMFVFTTPIITTSEQSNSLVTAYVWDTTKDSVSYSTSILSDDNDICMQFSGPIQFFLINNYSFLSSINPNIMKCGSNNGDGNLNGYKGKHTFQDPFSDPSSVIIIIAGLNGSPFHDNSLASVQCYDADYTGFSYIKTYGFPNENDMTMEYHFADTDYFNWIAIDKSYFDSTNNSHILQVGICDEAKSQGTCYFPNSFEIDSIIVIATVNSFSPQKENDDYPAIVSVNISNINKDSFDYTKMYVSKEINHPKNMTTESFFWLAIDPTKLPEIKNIFIS